MAGLGNKRDAQKVLQAAHRRTNDLLCSSHRDPNRPPHFMSELLLPKFHLALALALRRPLRSFGDEDGFLYGEGPFWLRAIRLCYVRL